MADSMRCRNRNFLDIDMKVFTLLVILILIAIYRLIHPKFDNGTDTEVTQKNITSACIVWIELTLIHYTSSSRPFELSDITSQTCRIWTKEFTCNLVKKVRLNTNQRKNMWGCVWKYCYVKMMYCRKIF